MNGEALSWNDKCYRRINTFQMHIVKQPDQEAERKTWITENRHTRGSASTRMICRTWHR